MVNPSLSLNDLLGEGYIQAVCEARAFAEGVDKAGLEAIASQKVELAPQSYRNRLDELVDCIGTQVCPAFTGAAAGAGTRSYDEASHFNTAPLSGFGFIRVGEDGRAYLASKSEHYHASLGHGFPGYDLITKARQLGILNATHNSTRGHVTRLLEQELVRVANGLPKDDVDGLRAVIDSTEPHVLNRVLNMETGSLVVEAALKMILAQFYRVEDFFPEPRHYGRRPVFLVMADHAGGTKANYHGTTVLTQVMRAMWPGLADALEGSGGMIVRPVRINDVDHFRATVAECDQAPNKVAGFFHEIVLMNYGGIKLEEEYLQQVYEICHAHDVATVVDEIQSCIWSPDLFLFREYGLRPDFVSVGKGFPGGEYPASRVVSASAFDNLNQFGAIVTNGQEELASLAYLITIAFAEANSAHTKDVGDYYEAELRAMAARNSDVVDQIEGMRHLSSVVFSSVEKTVAFTRYLTKAGIDISAHTYKADCPPAALTKIPLISTYKMVDFVIAKMEEALASL
jgi:4-aminobutyrate aminotransferase-like enzyme